MSGNTSEATNGNNMSASADEFILNTPVVEDASSGTPSTSINTSANTEESSGEHSKGLRIRLRKRTRPSGDDDDAASEEYTIEEAINIPETGSGSDEEPNSKKAKCAKLSAHSHKWGYWLFTHYETYKDAVIPKSDVVKDMVMQKDILGTCANERQTFLIISYLWRSKVKIVKRGPRQKNIPNFLNLRRRPPSVNSGGEAERNKNDITTILGSTTLPAGWDYELIDKDNVNFFLRTRIEFCGQRIYIEVRMYGSGSVGKFTLRAHDCFVDLNELFHMNEVTCVGTTWRDQMVSVMQYLSCSALCHGVSGVEEHDDEQNMCITGKFHNLDATTDTSEVEMRSFSAKCQILASLTPTRNMCTHCSALKYTTEKKMHRRQIRREGFMAKKCNIRYMSKDEVTELLKNEKRKRRALEERLSKIHDVLPPKPSPPRYD